MNLLDPKNIDDLDLLFNFTKKMQKLSEFGLITDRDSYEGALNFVHDLIKIRDT